MAMAWGVGKPRSEPGVGPHGLAGATKPADGLRATLAGGRSHWHSVWFRGALWGESAMSSHWRDVRCTTNQMRDWCEPRVAVRRDVAREHGSATSGQCVRTCALLWTRRAA